MQLVRSLCAVSAILLVTLPRFAQADASISAMMDNHGIVRLSWNGAKSLAELSVKKLDGSSGWVRISSSELSGAALSESSESYGVPLSPGSGSVVVDRSYEYVFRVAECAVVATGSMGSDRRVLCGEELTNFEGTLTGAVAESLPVNAHASEEFSDIPIAPALGGHGIFAVAMDQSGNIRLNWSSSAPFVEIQKQTENSLQWANLWYPLEADTGEYPTVQPPIGSSVGPIEIAPVGESFLHELQSGRYRYRMRGCMYHSPDRGDTFYRTCDKNYAYSETISVESVDLANLPPLVSFESPSANASVVQGNAVTAKVRATDIDITGFGNSSNQIAKVEFFITQTPGQLVVPSQPVHTSSTPVNGLYQYSFSPNQLGNYYLTAVATDTGGEWGYAVSTFQVVAGPTNASTPINTQRIDFSRYAVYYGDFDGDRNQDIYFHGTPLLVLLHGDIVTPIHIPAPPGFAYFGTADGRYNPALEWDMTEAAVKEREDWSRAVKDVDFVLGDMSGDGNPDILVKGRNDRLSTLLISGTEGQTLPQILLEVLATGQTRKPGQTASEALYFTDNLSSTGAGAVTIAGGQLVVNGNSFTLNSLQQTESSEGASQATEQNISGAPLASLPSPTLSAAEIAEVDSFISLNGEFRVNEVGSATYHVPLALPAGTAGVAPEISLAYSSQGGVGNMGLGWALAAGGGISRCRQTLQADGQALPIRFGVSDRFCLNGQRLLVMPEYSYGATGAIYKPELDTGTTVVSVGGSEGHPDYFLVTAKDGSTSRYGESDADHPGHFAELRGRDENGAVQTARTMNWHLSEFKDSVGNRIVYIYESEANFHRLKSVAYGYGPGDSSTADVSVTFTYGIRKRFDPYWVSGSRFADNSLLTSVEISDRTQLVQEYRVAYNHGVYDSGADLVDRVSSIKSCLGDRCSRPLRLKWGFASPGAASKGNGRVKSRLNSILSFSGTDADSYGWPVQRIVLGEKATPNWSVKDLLLGSAHSQQEADIDGDGRPDLLAMSANSTGFALSVFRQTPAGFGAAEGVDQLPGNPGAVNGREDPQLFPVDFNADGRTDLAVYLPATKTWRTYFSEPQTYGGWKLIKVDNFLPPVETDDMRFADISSNGLPDAVYTKDSTLFVHYLERRKPVAGETEQDVTESSRAYAYRSSPDIATPTPGFDTFNFGGVHDFDEDGLVDISGANFSTELVFGSDTSDNCRYKIDFEMHLAVGAPLASTLRVPLTDEGGQTFPTSDGPCDKTELRRKLIGPYLTDINNDGLSDLVWSIASRNAPANYSAPYYFRSVYFRLGKKDRTFAGKTEVPLSSLALGFVVMDVNSDGNQDLLLSGKDDAKWVARGDGTSFGAMSTFLSASPGRRTRYSDINGDGNLDRVVVQDSKLTVTRGAPQANDLVVQFETGLGAVTSVSYEPLYDSGRYSTMRGIGNDPMYSGEDAPSEICYNGPDTFLNFCIPSSLFQVVNSTEFYAQINEPFSDVGSATSLGVDKHLPAQEMMSAMPIVTRVASSAPAGDNISAMAGVDYRYEGLKVQAGGRGLLGFKKLSTIDIQTGTTTETQYRQDWPFVGSPAKTTTMTRHGQLLKQSFSETAIYGVDEDNLSSKRSIAQGGTSKLGPLVIYTSKASDIKYDVPDSLLTMPGVTEAEAILSERRLSEVSTETEVDEYGNIKEVVSNTFGLRGQSFELVQTQTTKNWYYQSVDGQRLGRLQTATVTTTRAGKDPHERTATFTYYGYPGAHWSCSGGEALKGLLCSERVSTADLQNSAAPEEKLHYYDQFGNQSYTKVGARASSLAEYDGNGRFAQATYDVFRREAAQGASPEASYSLPSGAVAVKTSEVLLRDKFGNATLSRVAVGNGEWLYKVQAATQRGTVFFHGDSTGAYQETRLRKTLLTSANWCPYGTMYASTINKAGGAETTRCFDLVGQEVGAYVIGFDGNPIRSRKEYDNLGRVVRVSEPTNNAAPSSFTTTTYDVLGRPLRIVHPFRITSKMGVEGGADAITDYSYDALTTVIETSGHSDDGVPRTRTETRNVLGELISVQEMGLRSIRYEYDSAGNLTDTFGPAGAPIAVVYNGLGQKIRMIDPDKGTWHYEYDSYGQLNKQTDANGTAIHNYYDFKSRKTRQEVRPINGTPAHTTRWEYDIAARGLGQIAREVKLDAHGAAEFTRQFTFDSLGRSSTTITTFNGIAGQQERHYEKVTYDEYGRVFQSFDAARTGPQYSYHGIQNRYNNYGYLYRVEDAANGGSRPFYTVKAMDARGNVTNMLYGSGEEVVHRFHPDTGFLTDIQRSLILDQHYTAAWDHLGNMVSRTDGLLGGTVETFKYDEHNRLVQNTLGGKAVDIQYNLSDNIVSKSDLPGSNATDKEYSYHSIKKHAVTKVGARTFKYDGNGNMIEEKSGTTVAKSLEYTGNDLVAKITTSNGHVSEFSYGTSDSRYKRTDVDGTGRRTTTFYLGSVEKVHHADGIVEWKRQVGGVAQVVHRVTAGRADVGVRHYFHKDHLGSVIAVTDSSGSVLRRMAFDPWGARRAMSETNVWQPASMNDTNMAAFYKTARPHTHRGFTGHEMLDEVGIIHMNGRIYDATLGRFLQADPFIQAPNSVGSLNRYSYLMNNPLNGVDPSGYIFHKLWRGVIKSAVRIFGAEFVSIAGAALFSWLGGPMGAAMWTYQFSRAMGVSSGDAFRSAAITFVSASAFSHIGKVSGNWHVAAKAVAHGTVGGVSSVLQGGKFGHGFVSAGFTKFAMSSLNFNYENRSWGAIAGRTTIAATIGGTVSEVTGGKFANGARTAAMAHILNAEGGGIAANVKESAQKENPAQALANAALKDGHLTLSEANSIYGENTDPNFELTVDASKLRVSPNGAIPLDGNVNARVVGLGDWFVHGNVNLRSVDGVLSIGSELYDFDYKPGFSNWPRNVETYIGEVVAGDGMPFRINFDGSPSVAQPTRRSK